MKRALGIDHPLILVKDIEAAAAQYRRLGFNTAPVGFHPWGTSTCLVMFDRCSLELMSIYDESLLDTYRAGDFAFGGFMHDALSAHEGMSLVALYSEDATADRAAATARGVPAQGRIDFRRKVSPPGMEPGEAVVSLEILLDPALPRVSNFICQQHRPELIWVPAWMSHPNGACGIAAVTYAARDPAPLLARFRGLFGDDAVRPGPVGQEARTGNGVFRVAAPGAWSAYLGAPGEPGQEDPIGVGIDVRVPDVAAVEAILAANGVAFLRKADSLVVADHVAFGNVLLRFVPA